MAIHPMGHKCRHLTWEEGGFQYRMAVERSESSDSLLWDNRELHGARQLFQG